MAEEKKNRKINIIPFSDNILIEPLEADIKTASGIILPDSAKEKPQEGLIMAVGKGALIDGKLIPMNLQKGQKVIYKKWGGNEVKIDGKDLMIIKQEDILAILE